MDSAEKNALAIQRLTALWALSESGLGGLFHAFKIPFAGLVLCGIAVTIISLLCHFSDSKWKTVTSALILVLIVKGLVAPHTQFTAYIAVSFQAFSGIIFYKIFPFRLATVLFSVIAVLESAFQRLLTLTILFGSSFWEAIDDTGAWIVKQMGFINSISSSKFLITLYSGTYFLGSLFVAYIVFHLIAFVKDEEKINSIDLLVSKSGELNNPKKKKNRKIAFLFLLGVLIGLVAYSSLTSGMQKGVYIFVRTMLILIVWFVFVGPILLKLVNKILAKKKAGLSKEIEHIFDLFPFLRSIISIAWDEAKEFSYLKRWKEFLTRIIIYSLYFKTEKH